MLEKSAIAAVWPLSTCLALTALGTNAEAAVLNVCHQGCKYSTIQSAVNAAASGDQISIAKGIYTENVSIDGKKLVLDGAGSQSTIVDGSATVSPVFTLGSTVNPEPTWHHITLQNMTITNGDTIDRGGGVLVQTGATLILRSSVVIGNHATERGGGVAISTPGGQISEIVDSRIEANHATPQRGSSFGGGIWLDGGSSLSIVDSEIRGNGTGAGGGGLEAFPGSQVWIQRTRFDGNSATGWFHLGVIGGTGGAIDTQASSLSISNSTFTDNFADTGGALNVAAFAGDAKEIVLIKKTTISGNTAGGGQEDVGLQGAGINVGNFETPHTTEVTLDHVYLSDNQNLTTQTEDDLLTSGPVKVHFTDTTIKDPVNSGCIGASCGK